MSNKKDDSEFYQYFTINDNVSRSSSGANISIIPVKSNCAVICVLLINYGYVLKYLASYDNVCICFTCLSNIKCCCTYLNQIINKIIFF